jgi:hypothetical protein
MWLLRLLNNFAITNIFSPERTSCKNDTPKILALHQHQERRAVNLFTTKKVHHHRHQTSTINIKNLTASMDGEGAVEWTAEMSGHSSRWLETASDLYDQVEFKTDVIFNGPAPEYWVSFVIGGVSGFAMKDETEG